MTLNPCPFCGKAEIVVLTSNDITEADRDDDRYEPDPSYAAVCDFNRDGCGATSGYRDTQELAAQAWNRRS